MTTQIIVLVFGFIFGLGAGAASYLALAAARAQRASAHRGRSAAPVLWALAALVALFHLGLNMWLAVSGVRTLSHSSLVATVNIIAGLVVCAALAYLAWKAGRSGTVGRQ